MPSPIRSYFDRRDDRRAHAFRDRLGPRGWLVSWNRVDRATTSMTSGPPHWLARVSCPDWPSTVEGRGPSRVRAAHVAVARLEKIVSWMADTRFASNPGGEGE